MSKIVRTNLDKAESLIRKRILKRMHSLAKKSLDETINAIEKLEELSKTEVIDQSKIKLLKDNVKKFERDIKNLERAFNTNVEINWLRYYGEKILFMLLLCYGVIYHLVTNGGLTSLIRNKILSVSLNNPLSILFAIGIVYAFVRSAYLIFNEVGLNAAGSGAEMSFRMIEKRFLDRLDNIVKMEENSNAESIIDFMKDNKAKFEDIINYEKAA